MKKQKTKLVVMVIIGLLSGIFFVANASASGSATVSWVAPTTDAGGGALGGGTSDLAGYRVYYKQDATFDCTAWNAADQTTRKADAGTLLPTTKYTVASPTTLKYACTDASVIIPGHTYYFAVVAYDNSGNLSDCASGSGTISASKAVSYPADISTGSGNASLHKVDGADFSLLHAAYAPGVLKVGNAADINADDYVNGADYSFLHAEYNMSF